MNLKFLEQDPHFIKSEEEKEMSRYHYQNGLYFEVYPSLLYWNWKEKRKNSVTIWDAPLWFRSLYKRIKIEQHIRNSIRYQLLDEKAMIMIIDDLFWDLALSHEEGRRFLDLRRNREDFPLCAKEYLKECKDVLNRFGVHFDYEDYNDRFRWEIHL